MEIDEHRIERATGGLTSIGEDWVSGSACRNLILEQPALTWLKYWGDKQGFQPDPIEGSFFGHIVNLGNKFEANWTKNVCGEDSVRIMDEDTQVHDVGMFLRTVAEMEKNTPVILHGALLWAPERCLGALDVLCLESWLFAKFPRLKPRDFDDKDDCYCVLDVKFTSELESRHKIQDLGVYSAQIRLYSFLVGQLQGRMPKRAFLATRDTLDCPIAVDVPYELDQPLDPYLADLRDQFLHIKLHGDTLLPWRDPEVAVNFADDRHQEPWTTAIRRIGEEKRQGSPVEWLPQIGRSAADCLKRIGYNSIEDMLAVEPDTIPLEDVPTLGHKKARLVRAVLGANKTGKPSKIEERFLPPKKRREFFLDYEWLNNLSPKWDNWPDISGCPMVFLAGVGWMDDGEWRYREFMARADSKEAERELFTELIEFFDDQGAFKGDGDCAIYHYSGAERTQSQAAANFHDLPMLSKLPLVDLQKTVYAIPLAFPGQWDFGLKTVAKKMTGYAPQFPVKWPEEMEGGGMAAMLLGFELYQSTDNPLTSPQRKLLSKYLQTDVYSMHQLLAFMRANAVDVDAPQQPRRKTRPPKRSRTRRAATTLWWEHALAEAEFDLCRI